MTDTTKDKPILSQCIVCQSGYLLIYTYALNSLVIDPEIDT